MECLQPVEDLHEDAKSLFLVEDALACHLVGQHLSSEVVGDHILAFAEFAVDDAVADIGHHILVLYLAKECYFKHFPSLCIDELLGGPLHDIDLQEIGAVVFIYHLVGLGVFILLDQMLDDVITDAIACE